MQPRFAICLLLVTGIWMPAGVDSAGPLVAPLPWQEESNLQAEVREAERAFAKTMADRDHAAFVSFLSEEAVFVGPAGKVLRGRQQVAEGWKPFYSEPTPPFSWRPDRVEVVASGTLALSTGPVFDPSGTRIGTFTSTWRREPDGRWRVVLDSGCPPCP